MGVQSLILKYWGSEGSRSLIQLFHGAFAVGAFLAPLLCKLFISQSNTIEQLPASCLNQTDIYDIYYTKDSLSDIGHIR